MKNNHIGTKIKSARARAGMSQADLAMKCGWEGDGQQARISHYENNRRSPSFADLDAIAGAMGLQLVDLIGDNQPATDLNKVPLIDTINVSHNMPPSADLEALDWIYCPTKHSTNTFAYRVKDDTMTNQSVGRSYPEGTIIFIDRDVRPKNGDAVVAYSPDNHFITFKAWMSDFGKEWLKPLNRTLSVIDITDKNVVIVGTLIGSYRQERRYQEFH